MLTNIVHNEDCIEGMKRLPDNSVDFILTDPPFNISKDIINITINKQINPYLQQQIVKTLDFGEWDKFNTEQEYAAFIYLWINECIRILKNRGNLITFSSKERISLFWQLCSNKNNGLFFRDIIVWHKNNPRPNVYNNLKFVSATEFMLWAVKGGKTPIYFNKNYTQHHNIIRTNICGGSERKHIHPCQKPADLIKTLLTIFTKPGDLVLDPFCGSGTVPVTCDVIGRKYIGFEKDPQWYDIITHRLRQRSLFSFTED